MDVELKEVILFTAVVKNKIYGLSHSPDNNNDE